MVRGIKYIEKQKIKTICNNVVNSLDLQVEINNKIEEQFINNGLKKPICFNYTIEINSHGIKDKKEYKITVQGEDYENPELINKKW